jgi:ATP-binding cassette, subfamily B, bacterial
VTDARARAGKLRRQLRLLRYARPHRGAIGLLVATMAADIGLDLLKPWPLKLIVDNVLGHHPTPAAVTSIIPGTSDPHLLAAIAAAATVLIFLLSTSSSALYNYVSLRIGQLMVFELAADLFDHLQRLSLRFHSRRQLGDTIERVTGDAYCVSTLVTDALIPAIQAVVMLAAMFVVMWSLEPTLTLIALGVLPFLVLVVRFLSDQISERAREHRDLEAGLVTIVEQTLGALPAVQAFAREEAEGRRFRRHAAHTLRASLRSTAAGIRFELLAGLVTAVGTAAVIYIGAELALRGKLTAGTIIVFLSYLESLYEPLESLTHTGQTVQEGVAGADRALEILDEQPEVEDLPGAIPAVVSGPVRYERVTFGYERGRPVLHEVSFEAAPGSTVAIVGPTGAGKTTLISLLVRFHDPWSGRVTIGGRDIREFRHRSLRGKVALVLQDPFLLPMTVAENIAYARPDASRAAIEAAARAARADEFIAELPDGYDTELGERGLTLSGGERQRLAIARAFLKDAPILILDEPTSALDGRTELALLEALERLMTGRITFLIAHRLSTIRIADQIIVLDRGRIVEQGTHESLLARSGLYSDLHRRGTPAERHLRSV